MSTERGKNSYYYNNYYKVLSNLPRYIYYAPEMRGFVDFS